MKKDPNHQNAVSRDQTSYWRDELNFAEFPIAALGNRAAGESLVFKDRIFDRGAKKYVDRCLTISPSLEYGLPTTLDEEVVLALIQLSAKRKFNSPRLPFTRYELIKEMGWDGGSKSYRRIDRSLRKWAGVTLYYDNAWWSKAETCWVTEHFHIIDRVTLLDRSRRTRRLETSPEDPNAGHSSVLWNELVFSSFQAGYLKKLDFEFLRSLQTPISKRIYRFLDKHFHKRLAWRFDLRSFACEHIGMSRSYSNSKIKEKLRQPLRELTGKRFLADVSDEARYERVGHGRWEILLRSAKLAQTRTAWKATPPRAIDAPLAPCPFFSLSLPEQRHLEAQVRASASPGQRRLLDSLSVGRTRAYGELVMSLNDSPRTRAAS